MGVYRQRGKTIWMLKYYRNGCPIYESSGTSIKDEATSILRKREGAIADGQPISNAVGKIRFEAAAANLVNEYKVNDRRSLAVLERRLRKHLIPFFANRKLSTITTAEVRRFVAYRQEQGIIAVRGRRRGQRIGDVSNAEINRELAVLKRMFTLAMHDGLLLHRPHIPMLRENNVRTGFFEHEQYEAVRRHLPASIQPVIDFAFETGWRIASEVLPLQWRNIDFAAGEIRLDAGTTKNGEGRVFTMTTTLRHLLEQQHQAHQRLAKRGMMCPWIFFRMVADGRGGQPSPRPITRFTKAWTAACTAAGCPGRIPHDFRRTAIRNMVRAGISERVAMKLSGHKTPSVFQRYNIVSDGDLREAAGKLNVATQNARRSPQN